MKILFSNIGYAKGIDGSLRQHITKFGRHFYCAIPVQEQVLGQIRALLQAEQPDLCCFVEIDSGSFETSRLNQIEALRSEEYPFHDSAGKYGQGWLERLPFHGGKSHAFLSRAQIGYERLYFSRGSKRLIYRLRLSGGEALYFSHFSLVRKTRTQQLKELSALLKREEGPVIVLADFNILQGFSELAPFLEESKLALLNRENEHTFTFHTRKLALDLCLCSQALKGRIKLKIIPQPFSDHAALLVDIGESTAQ